MMGSVCGRRALIMLFIFNLALLGQNWYAKRHYDKIEKLLADIKPAVTEISTKCSIERKGALLEIERK